MKTKTYLYMAVVSLFLVLVPGYAISQTNQNSPSNRVEQKSTSTTALEDAIRKVIKGFNNALVRNDVAAMLSYFADGEGMIYNSDSGRMSIQIVKESYREGMALSARQQVKTEYELTKLYVLPIDATTALANYVLTYKTTVNGKTDVTKEVDTDIYVVRNGRWLLRANHTESLPRDVEPIVAGMPTDWKRSTNRTATSYTVTVDTAVHHSGNASVSLRYCCGSDLNGNPLVSLHQDIDASAYKGKRVRLSGWMKTADAEGAELWLAARAERKMIYFDNQPERIAIGTADWKRYEIVVDVPDSAVNLVFGASLFLRGQAWFDDFAIEVVGADVPVTAKPLVEAGKTDEYLENVKRSSQTAPVNLGFENGAVK